MQLIVAVAGRILEPAPERQLALEFERFARLAGHDVDTLLLPFSGDPATALEELMAIRLMDLWDRGDRLVAIGAHASVLRHERKICWLLDGCVLCRPWKRAEGRPLGPEEELVRRALETALKEASSVFAASHAVAAEARELWRISCPVAGSSPSDAASRAESILKAVLP